MIQILLVKTDPLPFLRERHSRDLGAVAHLLVDDTEQSRGETSHILVLFYYLK